MFGQPFYIGALARAWRAIQTQTAHLRLGKAIGQLLQVLTAVYPLNVVYRTDVGLAIEVGTDALRLERVVQQLLVQRGLIALIQHIAHLFGDFVRALQHGRHQVFMLGQLFDFGFG